MIKLHRFMLAAALVGTLAALGCSSSSSSSSSGGSFYCMGQICSGASGFTASEKKNAEDFCKQNGGTPVASCPTANQIGCCENPNDSHKATSCYYQSSGDAGTMGGDAGPASQYEQSCTQSGGIWTTP